jgi:recombination protein RecA
MKKAKEVEKKENNKDLDETLKSIQTKFGEGAIIKMGDTPKVGINVIPTGSLGLDMALGVGGIPRGRIIEIFGPESSGKTTLASHIVAEAQKLGGICAYIDAEHAMDPEYTKKLGVKINDLLVSQPDTGEQALEIVESLVRSGKIDVIVVDSVAALTPKDEIEGDMGAYHVGKQARLMSQALRKLTAIVSKSKTVVIFINQIRMQIGVMFGNPETTPGGKALKFYTSIRLDIRKIASSAFYHSSLNKNTSPRLP